MPGPAWIQYNKSKARGTREYKSKSESEIGDGGWKKERGRERKEEERGFGEESERNGYLNKMKRGGTTDKKGGGREATDGTRVGMENS